jgi:hypothetical protein
LGMGVTALALAVLLPLLRAWRKPGPLADRVRQSGLLRRMSPKVALLLRTPTEEFTH